jgi:single-stranded-DNA-specific exonuclease
MSGGWHQGVIGIVAGRLKERFGRPAIVIAECEDGTGKGSGRSISGSRPRRGGARGQGQRAADRRRRPCDGGRADAAAGGLEPFREFINERLAADVEKRAATGRCCSTPCSRPAGRRRACATRSTRRALWRRLAGPARRRRAGAAAQDRHRRRRPCPRHRLRRRRQELQVDRLPQRRRPSSARRCSPRRRRRWWLAGTIKRDEWNGGNAAEMHLEDAALA